MNKQNISFGEYAKLTVLIIAILVPVVIIIIIWVSHFSDQALLKSILFEIEKSGVNSADLTAIAQFLNSELRTQFDVCISLIDIAIAVWLGLNIYNLLSKNEIEQLKLELKEKLTTLETNIAQSEKKLFILNKQILIHSEKDAYRRIKYCEEIIEKEPDLPENYNQLGMQYYNLGCYTKALECFYNAIQKSKNQGKEFYYEAEFNCYECQMQLGDYNQAASGFKMLIDKAPSDYELPLLIAEVFRRKKEYETALIYNRRAELLAPNNANVLSQYGRIYFDRNQKDDWKQAEEYLKRAIEIQKDLREAHYFLSELYKNTSRKMSNEQRRLAFDYQPD